VAVPNHGILLRFLFFPPNGWEIVQLVGLQTLNLAILVRVQVSQPNFFSSDDVQFPRMRLA
jgi:hypothetical protein